MKDQKEMCDPTTLVAASMLITAATAYTSYESQKSAAESQASAVHDYALAQSQNILNSTINNYKQGQQQMLNRNTAAGQRMQQENLQARAAAATSLASAGNAGVSGTSVQALQNEYANRQAEFNTDVAYNEKADDDEIKLQMQGFQNQGQSGLNQIASERMPVGPSILQPLLQFGAGAVSAYGNYLKIQPQGGGTLSATDQMAGSGMQMPEDL